MDSAHNIIKKKKINIEDLNCIKTITGHTDYVSSLLLLSDNRIASCSGDMTIRIYDPYSDYHCDQIIKRHSDGIKAIFELDESNIVSCSYDYSIMIGDYLIEKAHESAIFKVIALPNNRIASCSMDKTIKIWKSDSPYSDTPIKVLEEQDWSINSILYIKERDLLLSSGGDLRLWNMSTYQCETVIDNVFSNDTNSLYQIDKDRVIVGGKNNFTIVNIDKCVIEKKIFDKSFEYVNCFLKLRDNKTILCGCSKGLFCFYDMHTKQYKTIKKNHDKDISDLLMLNDTTFLSCSWDKTINVWKY